MLSMGASTRTTRVATVAVSIVAIAKVSRGSRVILPLAGTRVVADLARSTAHVVEVLVYLYIWVLDQNSKSYCFLESWKCERSK